MRKEKQSSTESFATNGGILLKIASFFSAKPVQLCLGALLVIFGMYVLLACLSFFFTGNEDQSILKNYSDSIEYLVANVKNWAGFRGAIISDFIINRTFGIPTLLYLFYFFVVSFWLLSIRPFKNMLRLFFICSFFVIWGSILMGSFVGNIDSSSLYLGGEHGYHTSLWLKANVGVVGLIALLIASLIVFSIVMFRSAVEFYQKIIDRFLLKKNVDPEVVAPLSGEEPLEGDTENQLTEGPTSQENENNIVSLEDNNETDDQQEEHIDVVQGHSTIRIMEDNGSDTEKNSKPEDGGVTFEVTNPVAENTGANGGLRQIIDDYQGSDEVVGHQKQVVDPSGLESEGQGEDDQNVGFEVVKEETEMAKEGKLELFDPTKDLEHYKKPTIDLFKQYEISSNVDMEEQQKNKNRILEVLRSFGVEISSIKATVGPTVTLYEVTPAAGVRISKIKSLGPDIALNIAAKGIRIIAPIPGKGTIGIEVPNAKSVVVPMGEIIGSKKFQESTYELPIALGKTITNEIFMLDLCKMPHVLVAGATGQGKSVGLNAIITSLLYKKHPSELKFVMVDPKMVEFSMYAPIEKHFLAKMPDAEEAIITNVQKVVQTLNSLCVEMDQRYELLKEASVRQVKEYNEKFISRRLNPEKGHHFMPYIVVIIDEFADLIMQVGKEVETPIARIAQKARAVGIHMILATQRPSANVITGVIRANFPARFAFRVASGIESRVILDGMGAEQLIGRGDMLISAGNEMERVQCAFVDTPEVERIASHISKQQGYPSAFILPEFEEEVGDESKQDVDLSRKDPLFNEVAQDIVASQQGSTSMIQRKYSIGYNRAGRIMDQMEAAGIVGPASGSKPRQVLITDLAYLDQVLNSIGNKK